MAQQHFDKGYGWVIMIAYFFVHGIVYGSQKSNGIMFTRFRAEYNATNTQTASVSSALGISEAITAIIFSFLAERFHHRLVMVIGSVILTAGALSSSFVTSISGLVVTYGVMMGNGMAMLGYPGFQIFPSYFDKKLAIAGGLGCTGSSVGTFLFPIVMTAAMKEYGLSGAFYIMAGIFLQTLPFSMLMWPASHFYKKSHNKVQDDEAVVAKHNKHTFRSLFKVYRKLLCNITLLLYLFVYFAGLLAAFSFMIFQQAHVVDLKIVTDHNLLAMLSSVWGIAELIFRPGFALILHFNLITPWRMQQIWTILAAITFAVYPFNRFYWGAVATCALVSGYWSAIAISLAPTFNHVVGSKDCGPALSLVSVVSLLSYLGIMLGGYVRDQADNFNYVFFSFSAISLVAFSAVTLAIYRKEKVLLPTCKCKRSDSGNVEISSERE